MWCNRTGRVQAQAAWRGSSRRSRRGGIIIILAVSLTVLCGFVAISFDIGYARLMRARLDMALEAASHAAALELDLTADGQDNAVEAAIAMAGKATIVGQPLTIDATNVEFGIWDDNLRTFTTETEPSLVNAVRVNANVTIPLLFGFVAFQDSDAIGGFEMDVNRVATSGAPGGAAVTSYILPFAIPDCYLDADADDVLDAGTSAQFLDAGGCATQYSASHKQAFMATAGPFSNAKMISGITDPDGAATVSIGDELGTDITLRVDNPNLDTTGGFFETFATTQTSSTTTMTDGRWASSPTQLGRSNVASGSWGKTIEGPAMVIDVDDDICTTGSAESIVASQDPATVTGEVIGFVWVAVYDIQKRCRQDSTGTQFSTCASKITSCSATTPSLTFSSRDRMGRIRLRVDTTAEQYVGSSSGGPDWGILAQGSMRLIPL